MSNDKSSRRAFIKRSGLAGAGIAAAQMLPLRFLQAQPSGDNSNPLGFYPNREWEKLYRNQYAYDRSFSWVCAPNDTHNCRITAHVRNGVIVRMGEAYDIGTYADLADLVTLADQGKVALHSSRYPLDAANDAIDDLRHGRIRGRAVLIPG